MLVHVMSDIGLVRATNEDSYICEPPLFVVADGMGGHVAGEIASKLAVATVSQYIEKHKEIFKQEELLKEAITKANTAVYQLSLSKEEFTGMGTTVTAAYMDGSTFYWGHVGDSRIYLLRKGTFRQMTSDHSLVWELVQSGSITKEEAKQHPKRNMLMQAVGASCIVKIDTGAIDLEAEDMILMCTDGLTNMVSEEEIYNLLNTEQTNLECIVNQLVVNAKNAGGLDNITTILIKNGDA